MPAPRLAIMQPYLFPYIGYFHLIDASSRFIFYDDVNFITRRGWINRNRILVGGRDHVFSVPVSHASQRVRINETRLAIDDRWRNKFACTLSNAYRKAPYFAAVEPMVTSVLAADCATISELAIRSIVAVLDYLRVPFCWTTSTVCSPHSHDFGRANRLIAIVREQGFDRYVNTIGGEALYDKAYFASHGVELSFVRSMAIEYRQFGQPFVPSLSIIDMLMFNSPTVVRGFIKQYTLN